MHLQIRRCVEAFTWLSLLIVVTCGDILVRTVEFSKTTSSEFADQNQAIRNLQQVKSLTRCIANCIREAKCLSIYYKDQGGECELYDTVAGDLNGKANQRPWGWRYYGLDSSILETKMAATTTPKITATTPGPTSVLMTTAKRGPKDCYEHVIAGSESSGKYTIYVKGLSRGLEVYCDMEYDGGGWTRFHTRITGNQNFYRNWAEYKFGFGDAIVDDNSEFWLGLDYIHLLTNQDDYQIRIPLLDFDGNLIYAKYDHFKISDESDNYRLSVSGYVSSSNAGDSMIDSHNGMPWSTFDRDNYNDTRNCADVMQGAWWYGRCLVYDGTRPYSSNLNGPWVSRSWRYRSANENGITWDSWGHESVKKAQMKIKPYLASK